MHLFRNGLATTPRGLKVMAVMNLGVLALLAAGTLALWLYFSPHLEGIATKAESFSSQIYRTTDLQQLHRIVQMEHENNIAILRGQSAFMLS